jgi:hypothetical protein
MDICTVRFRYPTSEAGTMARSLGGNPVAHLYSKHAPHTSCDSQLASARGRLTLGGNLGRQTRWFQLNRRAKHRCVVVCTKLDASCTHNPEQHTIRSSNSASVYGPVCFSFWQLLATKSCCGLPNAQLFSQLL